MLLDTNEAVLGLSLFEKAFVVLLLLILAILGPDSKITWCAMTDRFTRKLIGGFADLKGAVSTSAVFLTHFSAFRHRRIKSSLSFGLGPLRRRVN